MPLKGLFEPEFADCKSARGFAAVPDCADEEIKMLVLVRMKTFLRDIRGATAVEYVLIIAGVAVAIVGALVAFGDDITAFIEGLSGELGIN